MAHATATSIVTVHVGDELVEELLGPGQLEAKRPADGQILLEGLLELVHACAPGQGCATERRASRSTLAYMAVVSRLRWRRTWPTLVDLGEMFEQVNGVPIRAGRHPTRRIGSSKHNAEPIRFVLDVAPAIDHLADSTARARRRHYKRNLHGNNIAGQQPYRMRARESGGRSVAGTHIGTSRT
jgi:hypothetical protein